MKLNAHDVEGLYRLADDAQRDGDFTTADHLRQLLDAHEAVDRVGGTEEIDDVVEMAGQVEDLEETLETLGDALQLTIDENEAGNVDDIDTTVCGEVDRLTKTLNGLKGPDNTCSFEAVRSDLFDAVANLEDLISTLRGMQKRLEDSAKRAREALKEAGR